MTPIHPRCVFPQSSFRHVAHAYISACFDLNVIRNTQSYQISGHRHSDPNPRREALRRFRLRGEERAAPKLNEEVFGSKSRIQLLRYVRFASLLSQWPVTREALPCVAISH
jgi:hypothetical protein